MCIIVRALRCLSTYGGHLSCLLLWGALPNVRCSSQQWTRLRGATADSSPCWFSSQRVSGNSGCLLLQSPTYCQPISRPPFISQPSTPISQKADSIIPSLSVPVNHPSPLPTCHHSLTWAGPPGSPGRHPRLPAPSLAIYSHRLYRVFLIYSYQRQRAKPLISWKR